jgi:hypothetical protein
MRLPLGARSMFLPPPTVPPSCCSDHIRGSSATKESPFTAYAAAVMWLFRVWKNNSCPAPRAPRDHIG